MFVPYHDNEASSSVECSALTCRADWQPRVTSSLDTTILLHSQMSLTLEMTDRKVCYDYHRFPSVKHCRAVTSLIIVLH